MKVFDQEVNIPDINKIPEKLSPKELKTFEIKNKEALENILKKKRTMTRLKNHDPLPDTLNIRMVVYGSHKDITEYIFYNEIKNVSTLTYFNSDSIFWQKEVPEEFIPAQSLKFKIEKKYYANGCLKMKKLIFSGVIIKEYEYDKAGKLIKDYELSKNFRLSVIDVLKILMENNLKPDLSIDFTSKNPAYYLSNINTNRGKIWHLESRELEVIIPDKTSEMMSQSSSHEDSKNFLVLSLPTFKLRYKDQPIQEVEKQTGLTIYLQK